MVNLNLTAPLLLIRAVLPGMLDRGKRHIVNLSSGAGKVAQPFDAVVSRCRSAWWPGCRAGRTGFHLP